MLRFKVGGVYRRSEIHDQYGGNRQSGISALRQHPAVLLFTSESGERHGYSDGWLTSDTFLYSGEGQTGDMVLMRGNRAIRDHAQDGRELHLFEKVRKGYVRYVGKFEYVSHSWERQLDTNGLSRSAVAFTLRHVPT